MSSSVTPLAAALIGAGGAVFGGLLTTSGQLLIERGRAKRERQADERRQARELRLAVRLLTEELAESFSLVEESAKSRRYWLAPRQLPTATWSEYRTDIATAIESPAEWRYVTMAYDAINNLNWIVDHRRRTSGDTRGHQFGFFVEPDDQTREVWRALRKAIETLEETLKSLRPPLASAAATDTARAWSAACGRMVTAMTSTSRRPRSPSARRRESASCAN